MREHSDRTHLAGGVVWYAVYNGFSDYLEKLLHNAEFDHYIELLNKFDYNGHSALGCYNEIQEPESISNPEEYCKFANYMLDHYEPGRCRFLEDIVKYFGDEVLTRKFNQKCPLHTAPNFTAEGFWRKYGEEHFLPEYIMDKNATLIAGAELLRYSFGIEPFDNIAEEATRLISTFIRVCSDAMPPIGGKEEREKCCLRVVNCMKALLEKVDLNELDLAVRNMNKARSIENTEAWFVYQKVNYQPILDLVKHKECNPKE